MLGGVRPTFRPERVCVTQRHKTPARGRRVVFMVGLVVGRWILLLAAPVLQLLIK